MCSCVLFLHKATQLLEEGNPKFNCTCFFSHNILKDKRKISPLSKNSSSTILLLSRTCHTISQQHREPAWSSLLKSLLQKKYLKPTIWFCKVDNNIELDKVMISVESNSTHINLQICYLLVLVHFQLTSSLSHVFFSQSLYCYSSQFCKLSFQCHNPPPHASESIIL